MIKRILYLLLMLPFFMFSQHTIKGNFYPVKDFTYAILYRVTTDELVYIDYKKINENGDIAFHLKEDIPKGMYRIVYGLPQETKNFDFIYNAEEDIEFTFTLKDNVNYLVSKENKMLSSYNVSINKLHRSLDSFYANKIQDQESYKRTFDLLENTQSHYEKISEGTYASTFIKASRMYVPEQYVDQKTFIAQLMQNYFKYINFGDPVLQNSNFLQLYASKYITTFINKKKPIPYYKKNISEVVRIIGNNPKVKKAILKKQWQQFSKAKIEEVANYITDAFLLPIVNNDNDKELKKILINYKNVSLGHKAPDFDIEIEEDGKKILTKLSQLDIAEHYAIVFWSSTCSHCLDQMPKIKTFSETLESGRLKVIAFGLEDAPEHWRDEIYKYPSFIHVYGINKWKNKIALQYNVSATPTYYILNRDKEIISKPKDLETFKSFFDR